MMLDKNIKNLNDIYTILSNFDDQNNNVFGRLDVKKDITYTKTQLADLAGIRSLDVQHIMDELESHGEYFAKDKRNWSMMTRKQALKIMAKCQIYSIQNLRKTNDYNLPVVLINKAKGGVGKTTTAIHLATQAAMDVKRNYRVLLIDGDAQGSLRHYFTNDINNIINTVSQLIKDNSHLSREERLSESNQKIFRDILIEKIILKSHVPNLDILPSVLSDIELSILISSELGKGRGIAESISLYKDIIITPLSSNYDLVIIDSGPSPDTVVYNLLYAANYLIIPTTGRVQDYRAYLNNLNMTRMMLSNVMPKDKLGFYEIKTLITKHTKKTDSPIEKLASRHIAHSNAFSTKIIENSKYEEAAQAKLPIQILKTSNTQALRDAVSTLHSFYNEFDAMLQPHLFTNSNRDYK